MFWRKSRSSNATCSESSWVKNSVCVAVREKLELINRLPKVFPHKLLYVRRYVQVYIWTLEVEGVGIHCLCFVSLGVLITISAQSLILGVCNVSFRFGLFVTWKEFLGHRSFWKLDIDFFFHQHVGILFHKSYAKLNKSTWFVSNIHIMRNNTVIVLRIKYYNLS